MSEPQEIKLCDVCQRPESTDPIDVICDSCYEGMNKDSFCKFCNQVTATDYWDCMVCKLSKPHEIGVWQ